MGTGQVISGLEDVLAFESSIAHIDGAIPELSFRGYPIQDIAQTLTFEEVAFLLWEDSHRVQVPMIHNNLYH